MSLFYFEKSMAHELHWTRYEKMLKSLETCKNCWDKNDPDKDHMVRRGKYSKKSFFYISLYSQENIIISYPWKYSEAQATPTNWIVD